jgi:hypothetical protein
LTSFSFWSSLFPGLENQLATKMTSHHDDFPQQEQHRNQASAFVESMTFAKRMRRPAGGAGCECDECGFTNSATLPSLIIPPPIRLAIQQHKRIKRETQGLTRTQVRTLVRRWNHATAKCTADSINTATESCTVALWQWFLPCGAAEPLTEFGNADVYRLIWVSQLPKNVQLSHIGPTGIVGSQAEEQGRVVLHWRQGSVYLVPSVPGRAVGWVATPIQSESASQKAMTEPPWQSPPSQQQQLVDGVGGSGSGGPVVLYIAKIAVQQQDKDESVTKVDEATNNDDSSLALIRSIFVRVRHQFESSAVESPSLPLPTVVSYCQLNAADSAEFQLVVSTML